MSHLRPSRIIPSLVAMAILVPLVATSGIAQEATPSVGDPMALTEALTAAEPPAQLPGDNDDALELVTWEEYYGEALDNTEGAWVLTGAPEFPLATVIVFASNENARTGIEGYAQDESPFTVSDLEAWTVADRGKWICITATGPMVVIGQAFPENTDEPEADVEARSCAVLESTLTWLSDDVIGAPLATPSASPTSES